MKNRKTYLILLATVFVFSFFQVAPVECNPKDLKEKAKDNLDPFQYDTGKITRLKHTAKDQIKEVEIPMFIGEKYRLSFNLEALKKTLEINIYNKAKDNKNRKLLYSNKDKFEKEFTVDFSRMRHVFVDYSIPAGTNGEDLGCAVFVLGYR